MVEQRGDHMKHEKPVLLECHGHRNPTNAFLLAFQREVLYALAEHGMIDQETLSACMEELSL